MKKRLTDDSAPFQRIDDAARLTGLPRGYLRDGAKTGDIPCVWHGRSCLVNVPALLRKLDAEDAARAGFEAVPRESGNGGQRREEQVTVHDRTRTI